MSSTKKKSLGSWATSYLSKRRLSAFFIRSAIVYF
jgi:hypothetical protein